MNTEEIEDLFIRSLDQSLTDTEKEKLASAIEANQHLAASLLEHKKIREMLSRKNSASFGPYFAQKVIARINSKRIEIDHQIMFFFKKYQLAALGVIMALLAGNAMFAEQLDLPSILGIEETTATPDDDLLSFDFYENFNE